MNEGGEMIPALAFNDAITEMTSDVNVISDHYAAVTPTLNAFSLFEDRKLFKAKRTSIMVKSLLVAATSKSAIYFEREDEEIFALNIPINGLVKTETDGYEFLIRGGNHAFLSTPGKHKTFASGSGVLFRLDKEKLLCVCLSMIGGNSHHPALNNPRALQLEYKKISFFQHFRLLLSQIDIAGGNAGLLEKLAFDDRVYRLAAGLICPDLLLVDEPVSGRRPHESSALHMLCEYLCANLRRPVSLTQMEQMSELSARKLQHAFRKEFGIGARAWLRKQRLHAARSALLDTHQKTTVEFVAYDFCFVSPSEFSLHYQHEFGELPEQTFSRRRS